MYVTANTLTILRVSYPFITITITITNTNTTTNIPPIYYPPTARPRRGNGDDVEGKGWRDRDRVRERDGQVYT